MLIPRIVVQCSCLFFLAYPIEAEKVRRTDSYSSHGDKHLNEADIASMLKNLDHDSSTLLNGSKVLEHTKPEKSEIIEDDRSGSSDANLGGSNPIEQLRTLGITSALESGEKYLTGKPIKIKDNEDHEDKSSFVYHSIKPEDDDWLKRKVQQIKNSNF